MQKAVPNMGWLVGAIADHRVERLQKAIFAYLCIFLGPDITVTCSVRNKGH